MSSKETEDSGWVGERIDLALESAEIGLWDLDLVNGKGYRTLKHDQVFGYETPLAEWSFEIFLSHVLPEDRYLVKQGFEAAYATGSFHTECRIMRRDQAIRWIAAKGRTFRDDQGVLVRLMGSVADITARKVSEAELVQQKDMLERFFALSVDMVCIAGSDGIFKRVNPAFGVLGFPTEELLSRPFLDFVHPDDVAATLAEVEKLNKGVRTIHFENRYRCQDGSYRRLAWSSGPDSSGNLYCIARDVTDLKASEETRRRLSAIVDASNDAIVTKTLDGVIIGWNRGAEQIFGWGGNETIGQPDTMLFPPERLGDEDELIGRVRRGERVDRFETVRRRKDGRDIDVSITLGPVRDSAGDLIGVSKVIRDITETKRVQELVRAKEAADTANRELESFSYSVAHDLRAPLRSIDGFSQALLEDCGDSLGNDGMKYLGFIRESAQLMAQLIDDMLTLSRVTRSELVREPVDLGAVARAALARLVRVAPDRIVEAVIQDGLLAHGDARLLAVVFDNLVGNAWKFTSKRERARIEFGATTEDGRLTYFVRDNGVGFDMTYANKLFGVFQRLHSAREFEGTGVGLATVQRIVRRHGGRVWAEGTVDAGATLYFTLGEKE